MVPTEGRRSRVRWILVAAVVGFVSSFFFSSVLQLPRQWFVAAHTALTVGLWTLYAWREGVRVRTQLARRVGAGLIGGVVFGALLARQVLAQPASTRPEGPELLAQLLVSGGIYGVVDAVLLSILPVLATYGSRPSAELQRSGARLRWAGAALLGSIVVTGAYHFGFEEFRGPELVQPIVGNTVITLSFLLTGSPLAPLLAHVAMHGAAVLHGAASTVQLPPHY